MGCFHCSVMATDGRRVCHLWAVQSTECPIPSVLPQPMPHSVVCTTNRNKINLDSVVRTGYELLSVRTTERANGPKNEAKSQPAFHLFRGQREPARNPAYTKKGAIPTTGCPRLPLMWLKRGGIRSPEDARKRIHPWQRPSGVLRMHLRNAR